VLPFAGDPAAVPGPLAGLLDDGTLTAVQLQPDAVVTHLAAGRSWTADGARVRSAVHRSLEHPGSWLPGPGSESAPSGPGPLDAGDAQLEAVARELARGEAGRLASSHGGTIEVLGVQDGVVRLRLGGSCDGCPAAGTTLHLHLEAELRRRCPSLREVRAETTRAATTHGGLSLIPRRR
jgi:Fe-S cluster biogenesis protein NfuA